MKYFWLLSLIFFSALHVASQNDTTLIYLDNNEKPCPPEKAVKIAVKYMDLDHWLKVVLDALDERPIYGAHYQDSACTILDGRYGSFHKLNSTISEMGLYSVNKKVGDWRTYSENGKLMDSAFYKDGFIYGTAFSWYEDGTIEDSLFFEENGKGICRGYWSNGRPKESGNFMSGKKNGLWTYNYNTGIKCQEVTYEADSVLTFTCYDEQGKVQTSACSYEKEAAFKGGDNAWTKYLTGRLSTAVLPKSYYEGRISGTVFVLFAIDINGKTTNIQVLNSVDPQLDDVAKMIIRQSPAWEPAVQYNRKVKVFRRQPITFAQVEK